MWLCGWISDEGCGRVMICIYCKLIHRLQVSQISIRVAKNYMLPCESHAVPDRSKYEGLC